MSKNKILFLFSVLLFLSFYGNSFAYVENKTGQVEATNQKLLSSVLKDTQVTNETNSFWGTGVDQVTTKIYEDCSLSCRNFNNYTYSFSYERGETQGLLGWGALNQNSSVNKCEKLKVKFSLVGDWGATLGNRCVRREDITRINILPPYIFSHGTPPADIINCSSQEDCLNKGKEYSLTPDTQGKGVHQIPANFITETEKSFVSSDNTKLPCLDGVCSTFSSGNFKLTTTAKETKYYGQCRGFGFILSPEGVSIPAVSSVLDLNVLNRAPLASLSLSEDKIDVNEEATATCDIIDPDTCSDKIVRVKWTCFNDKKEKVNCYFNKNGIWKEGELNKDISEAEQKNEYRSIVKWKAGKEGVYAITCEGTDNDETVSATGKAIEDITVGSSCSADGVCNKDCPYDPDCCSDLVYAGTHTQCNACGADGICNPNCPYDPDCCSDSEYVKTHSNLNQCVVSAGSCIITRTKPSLDVSLIEPFDPVDFQANVLGGFTPTGYTWYCDKTDSNISSENKSSLRSDGQLCDKYSQRGKTYEPKVRYSYKDENGNTQNKECTNSQGIAVKVSGQLGADNCSCIVLVRPDGSEEDYATSVKIATGEKVEAKLVKKCSKKDATTWTTDGMKIGTSTNTKALIQFNQGGLGYVKASIGSTTCKEAGVNVKEKVKTGI